MDYASLFRAILALGFVLGLVGLSAFFAKRMLEGRNILNLKTREKRLSILEIQPIDNKRRLVLIQRDNTEHLIMLGSNSELLIETGINTEKKRNS